MNRNLITITQAAKILNIHPDTLRRWEKIGKIHSLRFISRGHRRYRTEDILKIIKTNTEEEAQPSPTLNRVYRELSEKTRDETKSMLKSAKGIFFDVGHTLISLFPSREDIYAQIAFDYGFHVDPSEIRLHFNRLEKERQALIGKNLTFDISKKGIEDIWTRRNTEVLRRAGIPTAEALTIGNKIFHEIWSNPKLWRQNSYVEEFLTKLKNTGKILSIVDNWDNRLMNILKQLDLDKYFKIIILGGEIGVWKPDARIFRLALKKTGLKPNQVIYIGNNFTSDFMGSTKAGFKGLLFDNQRKHLEKKIPKFYKFDALL